MKKLFSSLVVGLAFPVACGGSSGSFDDREGDAGDPGTGGSVSGSGGRGGSVSTGGDAGTSPVGGSSGSSTGGAGSQGGTASGGSETGGTGTGGQAGEGATSGEGGTAGAVGGSAGSSTGGSGGSVGGSAGAGGTADPRCPFRPPMGTCDAEGLSCRYDLARQCLCLTVAPQGICSVVDPRCTAMSRILPPPDGGGAIPVATSTCDCRAGNWSCRFP